MIFGILRKGQLLTLYGGTQKGWPFHSEARKGVKQRFDFTHKLIFSNQLIKLSEILKGSPRGPLGSPGGPFRLACIKRIGLVKDDLHAKYRSCLFQSYKGWTDSRKLFVSFFLLYNKILSLPPVNIDAQLWTAIFTWKTNLKLIRVPSGTLFPLYLRSGTLEGPLGDPSI